MSIVKVNLYIQHNCPYCEDKHQQPSVVIRDCSGCRKQIKCLGAPEILCARVCTLCYVRFFMDKTISFQDALMKRY